MEGEQKERAERDRDREKEAESQRIKEEARRVRDLAKLRAAEMESRQDEIISSNERTDSWLKERHAVYQAELASFKEHIKGQCKRIRLVILKGPNMDEQDFLVLFSHFRTLIINAADLKRKVDIARRTNKPLFSSVPTDLLSINAPISHPHILRMMSDYSHAFDDEGDDDDVNNYGDDDLEDYVAPASSSSQSHRQSQTLPQYPPPSQPPNQRQEPSAESSLREPFQIISEDNDAPSSPTSPATFTSPFAGANRPPLIRFSTASSFNSSGTFSVTSIASDASDLADVEERVSSVTPDSTIYKKSNTKRRPRFTFSPPSAKNIIVDPITTSSPTTNATEPVPNSSPPVKPPASPSTSLDVAPSPVLSNANQIPKSPPPPLFSQLAKISPANGGTGTVRSDTPSSNSVLSTPLRGRRAHLTPTGDVSSSLQNSPLIRTMRALSPRRCDRSLSPQSPRIQSLSMTLIKSMDIPSQSPKASTREIYANLPTFVEMCRKRLDEQKRLPYIHTGRKVTIRSPEYEERIMTFPTDLSGQLCIYNGMAIHACSGILVLCDTRRGTLLKYDLSDNMNLVGMDPLPRMFQRSPVLPSRLTISPNGANALVVDHFCGRVILLDLSYNLIQGKSQLNVIRSRTFGPRLSSESRFGCAVGVAFDSTGCIYVADRNTYSILKFDRDCNFMQEVSGDQPGKMIGYVSSMIINDSDEILCISHSGSMVKVYDTDFNHLRTIPVPRITAECALGRGYGGGFTVCDIRGGRVYCFSLDGRLERTINTVETPTAVDFDLHSWMYLFDDKTKNIFKL